MSTVRVSRVVSVVTMAAALLLLAAPAASAHGDGSLVSSSFRIAAGEVATFTGELHYHRLVVNLSADGPIGVRLVGPNGSVIVDHAPATQVRINDLIRCCDDRTWTPHELVVTNTIDAAVTVRGDAQLVHDDLAVMALEAESGARSAVLWFAAIVAVILWFQLRRRTPLTLPKAWLTFGVAVTLVVLVGGYGAVRYGFAGTGSMVAGGSDVPLLPVNRYVSRATLLISIAVALWMWSTARWARTKRAASRAQWAILGVALVAAAATVGSAVATTYGTWPIPTALAAAVALPVLVAMTIAYRGRTIAYRGREPGAGPSPSP